MPGPYQAMSSKPLASKSPLKGEYVPPTAYVGGPTGAVTNGRVISGAKLLAASCTPAMKIW